MRPILAVPIAPGDDDHSATHRCPQYSHLDLTTSFATTRHGPTIGHMLHAAVVSYASRPAVAYRPLERLEHRVYHYGPTVTMTFSSLWDTILAFGRGLVAAKVGSSGRIALYEETRYEWLASCVGAWSQGIVPVTVFANLGDSAVAFALEEAEVSAVVVNGANVAGLTRMANANPKLRRLHVIYTDRLPEVNGSQEEKTVFASMQRWCDVVAQGLATQGVAPNWDADSEATAIIMYTSGTTGNPKGVELAHRSLVASVNGQHIRYQASTPHHEGPTTQQVFLAYLPLAHIFEFNSECIRLTSGAMVCYGRAATLLDDNARPHGDLREFQPHYLTAVPRIMETLRKAMPATATPAVVRALLGGRLLQMQSGGAPLNGPTQKYFQEMSGASVVQSWGLTEVCGAACVQREWTMATESVGRPIPSVEVRLRRTEGWRLDDPVDGPKGEVCLRGPILAKGYFKRPDLTREVFLPDGWFCTGDVGCLARADGGLRIVGRIKALAKNVLGEYVALEILEAMYVQNDLCIPNGTCVVVDPQAAFVVGVFITDETRAARFVQRHGLLGTYPDVLRSCAFQEAAQRALSETAVASGHRPYEIVRRVRFYDEEWTPQNEMLTAAMKLKRGNVEKRYRKDIEEMFSSPATSKL